MNKTLLITTVIFLISIFGASAQSSPQHGVHPTYGQVPYSDNEFYARYPQATGNFYLPNAVYGSYPAGISSRYGGMYGMDSYGGYGYGYGGYGGGAYGGYGGAYGNNYNFYPYAYGNSYGYPTLRYAGVAGSGTNAAIPAGMYGYPGSYNYGYRQNINAYSRPVLYPGIYRTYRI